ncbi:hypothetical protein M011DRAFT_59711 [Sporormia fimetaria CBS 119925]|uniref:Uncharacterized protein n=1 Tax=Sporormia fimetaria CBS 119925 TaxID=1340428 RepID=A0A6A6UX68_9PLEO|nr:hypothetical protein M011DRAFT_59711 [Sporormia fimetaria CBS 119925]
MREKQFKMASINNGTMNNFAQRDINIEAQTNRYYPAIIPCGRDPDFIEPRTIVEQIEQKRAAPGSRFMMPSLRQKECIFSCTRLR